MNDVPFLRIKKLKGNGIILRAAKHNHRQIAAEIGVENDGHIDLDRIKLNRVLRGPADAKGVANLAKSLMDIAGVKSLRRDAVRAIEVIFSLAADTTIDHIQYFEHAVDWVEGYFSVPVISAMLHLDEAAPHCHVLLLPLVRTRMVGSDLVGGRASLQSMHNDFYLKVGQTYGLQRQVPQKRMGVALRNQCAALVVEAIAARSDVLGRFDVRRSLVDAIATKPEDIMFVLGLTPPAPKASKAKTFVEIMTKPCKPDWLRKE